MQQRSVNVPSRVEEDGPGREEEETKTFLFQYLSKRSQRDKELPGEDADAIQQHGQEAAVRVSVTGGDSTAVNVASILADMGKSFLCLI